MDAFVYLLLGFVALLLLVAALWRLASRRQTLPCPVWLSWLVELDNPFTKTNRAAVIIEHLGLETGMAVLDVGCGPGRLTLPAARSVGERGEVVALDIQPGMLAKTRHKAQEAGLENIRFLEAGIGTGHLERNRFDRVLLVTVLGEIPDKAAAMREIFETLKPGGILSVTELIFDPHFQRQRTVITLARTVGFQQRATFGNRIAYTLHFAKPATEEQS